MIDCMQFSDLHRLLLVTAFVLQFIRHCRGRYDGLDDHTQSLAEELKLAERQ